VIAIRTKDARHAGDPAAIAGGSSTCRFCIFRGGVLTSGLNHPTVHVGKEGAGMSAAEGQEVKNLLLRSNDHYRELAERHHQLDDRLHELTEKHYLSNTEQLEEVTIKKRKLALKDQMEAIARDYSSHYDRAS
jgi:uncharacterized protein YdcH (DUF465 family)